MERGRYVEKGFTGTETETVVGLVKGGGGGETM